MEAEFFNIEVVDEFFNVKVVDEVFVFAAIRLLLRGCRPSTFFKASRLKISLCTILNETFFEFVPVNLKLLCLPPAFHSHTLT